MYGVTLRAILDDFNINEWATDHLTVHGLPDPAQLLGEVGLHAERPGELPPGVPHHPDLAPAHPHPVPLLPPDSLGTIRCLDMLARPMPLSGGSRAVGPSWSL